MKNRIKKITYVLVFIGISVPTNLISKNIARNNSNKSSSPTKNKELIEEERIITMVEELCEKYEVNKNVVLSLLYYNNGVGMDTYDYSLLNNPGHVLPCMIDYRNIDEAELYKINDSNFVIKFSNIES